jgi:hypothetical protein
MPPAMVPDTRCRLFRVVASSGCPTFILARLLSFGFVCRYLETPGFQCLYALGPAVAILSITGIRIRRESHSA